MTTTIKLQWRYIDPPPMTGLLLDLKQWVLDAAVPELETEFRNLLGYQRRRGISDEQVNAMANELYVLVKERQREEYEACKRADTGGDDLDSWLRGGILDGDS